MLRETYEAVIPAHAGIQFAAASRLDHRRLDHSRSRVMTSKSDRIEKKSRRDGLAPAFFGFEIRQFSFALTSAMPLASRSSATEPLTDCERMVEAAATAASAAAA